MTDNHLAPPVEPISHPEYYADLHPEPIEVIEAWELGFSLGNVLKYVSRAGKKPGVDALTDLCKAAWYLDREIKRRSGVKP